MENSGDGSLRVELFFKDGVEESGIEDVAFIEGDSFFVGIDVLALGKVVVDGLIDSIEVEEAGVDVVIDDGDVVVGLEKDLDGDV